MSLYLHVGVSVFVAMNKGNGQYYYKLPQKENKKLLFPAETISLPVNIQHIHANNCHYDVV